METYPVYRPLVYLPTLVDRHIGGHSEPRRRRKPPAWREPPEDRTAVILTFPLGWRATAKRPPARPAGKHQQRGSRLRMEPAELLVCDGCSCTRRDFQCLLGRH
ncbi:hypothetical protein NDU88_006813 [Pleurodeles waltl]|uniref:Uncharacterized protein n=1 Tax=Pleurodeles waltl TaxID=8319 RepID=A0AAV7SQP0_PLEWA|nr:hypothetical protein NDU88_006813 [Pleurodeles waltl]